MDTIQNKKKYVLKISNPSEKLDKYDETIKSLKTNIPISTIKMNPLHESLVWSEATFGCETQALAISLACQIPTFSSIPPWGNKCRLPHDGIIHIKDI